MEKNTSRVSRRFIAYASRIGIVSIAIACFLFLMRRFSAWRTTLTRQETVKPANGQRHSTQHNQSSHLEETIKQLRIQKYDKITKEYDHTGQLSKITGESSPKKTWLNLAQLLLIPFVLTLLGLGFTYQQHQTDTTIANDQQQQTILENYMARMTDLLLSKSISTRLYESKKGEGVRVLAQATTLMTLGSLNPERKRAVILFLYQADLILWHQRKTDPGFDFPILNLHLADLKGVDLSQILLDDTYLRGLYMSNANLSNSIIRNSDFSRDDLRGTQLNGTELDGTNFDGALLNGANLNGASLRGASFHGTDTDLSGANLSKANLSGAILNDANLTGVNLTGVNLTGARLIGAKLTGANLSDAKLTGAAVTKEQLDQAQSLTGAIMPDGSKHP